ncbi:MAG: DegQ family serine endoprotease [Pseudomonadota bacterium]
MNKKRFSLWSLVIVSFVSATLAIAFVAKIGKVNITNAAEDKIYHSLEQDLREDQIKPASWFEARPSSFADLAERVQSAVVNINTSKVVKQPQFRQFGPRDPFFNDFFDKFFEGMPREQQQNSLGSGFIINKDGDILTNNHVVSQADEIEVVLADGRKFKAEVKGKDEKSDIALISIKNGGKDLPYLNLGDSEKMRPGDWVMAIGNPFGLEHTVTVGVVSAKGRIIGGGPFAKFIQTDASINPGNSGGPLFNMSGEVIGINTMIHAGGQGIGFAIPINMAKDMLPQLASKGSITRGWLGVMIQDITPELAKSFKLKEEKGVLIAEVYSGSPAAKAGLHQGDIVLKFNGNEVNEPYDLSLAVSTTEPGKTATLLVLRDGEEKEIKLKIGQQEEETAAKVGQPDTLGLVVKPLSSVDRAQRNIPESVAGVVVTRIEPGSSAESANIVPDDLIQEVNGVKINSMADYNNALKTVKKGKVARILIRRGDASIYLAFTAR